MLTKHCPTCDGDMLLTDFTKHKKSKDGLYYECKYCKQARVHMNKEIPSQ